MMPVLAALLSVPALLLGTGEATLREKTLAEWRALVEPAESELAFTEIPWRPSFWSAVLEAEAQDKPVLLWAMNGHPLGCT